MSAHARSSALLKALIIFALLSILTVRVSAQTCEQLFHASQTNRLIHGSWEMLLEHDFEKMTKALGAVGTPIPQFGVGKLIYQHWQLGHESDAQLFRVGFKVVEPSLEQPNEVARFVFPATYLDMIRAIETAQGAKPTFKLATYGDSNWLKLDEPLVFGVKIEPETDLAFSKYANLIASGYAPLYPSSKTMGFMHDLSHITEYLEYPDVFPALQNYFARYTTEGWNKQSYYRQRAESFNEVSYILKPSRYSQVDFVLVSGLTAEVPVLERAKIIGEDLVRDPAYGIAMTRRLSDSFNDIFERHGGGARDFFNVDNFLIPTTVVEKYVQSTKADPSNGIFIEAIDRTTRIEAVESLEGLNRQIIFALGELEKKPELAMVRFLAYRVAQLEAAIVAQRALSLTQVDLIRDSAQPLGVETKTSRYFKAFQPRGSHHYNIFVGH